MKGAQVGFTEVGLNRQLYVMDYHPGPYLYVQKTVDSVERYSKQRLSPSIGLIDRIQDKIVPTKSRDSSNTIRLKTFPGGMLILGGANSAASMRSMPIRYLDLDEWDSYEFNIQEEGDPAELAVRRTANYPRRKIYYLSTPLLEETSKIKPKFLEGTQEYYYIRCIYCGHHAPIAWQYPGEHFCFTIKYKDNNPKTAALFCPKCEKLIKERHKSVFLSEENGAEWVAHNPKGDFPSFHLSSFYSPAGFYSWADCVKLWLRAQKNFDKDLLQVFLNTVAGETYSQTGKTVEATGMMKRREKYIQEVPKGVCMLVCGADVQDKKIECEVVGYGAGEESWSIEYRTFDGDTALDSVWELFDHFLQKEWEHESGKKINLAITMIDSGYQTRKVYSFCKLREHRRVYPVKGMGGWGKGLIKRPKRKNDDGVFLFLAYVDEIKSKVYTQLKVEYDRETVDHPQFCHFPEKAMYSRDFFRMLTAEKLGTKTVRGFKRLEWELPKGRKNEALDCRVYCIAGLNIINPDFDIIRKNQGVLYNHNKPLRRKRRMVSRGIS